MDKIILKTWISKRMSYFVGILRGIGDIFLPYCPQILFLLEVSFMGIFEPHKSPVQKGKFSYK